MPEFKYICTHFTDDAISIRVLYDKVFGLMAGQCLVTCLSNFSFVRFSVSHKRSHPAEGVFCGTNLSLDYNDRVI